MIILLSITRQFVHTQSVETTGPAQLMQSFFSFVFTKVWSFNAHMVQNERKQKTFTSVFYNVK